MPQPLLLTDAPHLLYRGFYALPDSITDADGVPVNALLGSVNQVLQVVEDRDPRAVVMCFGEEAADYRVEAYPEYHAHRPPMPDGLAAQWERAGPLYEALGWSVDSYPGLEADDLLHSLAAVEADAGGSVLILTGDRDMFQCATDRVHVLLQRAASRDRPAGHDEMGPEEVQERYGVPPAAVPDFIALRGDPSDGLPGAKGIGPKTAADLLKRHGSLEAAIKGAVREKPSVRRALLEQADELRAFRDIATLRRVDVPRPPDAPLDHERGAEAAAELGMGRLSKRLAEAAAG